MEVVVALGIFSLTAGVLVGAFWTSRMQIQGLDRGRRATEDQLAVRRIIGGYLRAATAPRREAGTHVPEGGFVGNARRMAFMTTLAEPAGLFRIELAIEGGPAGSRLLVSRRRAGDMRAGGAGSAAPAVLSRVYESHEPLAFAYADETPQGLSWASEWSQDRLPARVRIVEGGRALLTTPLEIALSASCLRRRGADGLYSGVCSLR